MNAVNTVAVQLKVEEFPSSSVVKINKQNKQHKKNNNEKMIDVKILATRQALGTLTAEEMIVLEERQESYSTPTKA